MALTAKVTLESTQDTIEVAVGLTRDGKVNLKVCGPVLDGNALSYRNIYDVFYNRKEEKIAVLRLKRNQKDATVVTCSIVTIKEGNTVYKGLKLPTLGTIGKGIGYKLNRFFGRRMFRISDTEMDHWAKSVAISMRSDAMRHARTMAK